VHNFFRFNDVITHDLIYESKYSNFGKDLFHALYINTAIFIKFRRC